MSFGAIDSTGFRRVCHTGADLIVIEGSLSETQMPIMDIDFALTTGTIDIGPIRSTLKVTRRKNGQQAKAQQTSKAIFRPTAKRSTRASSTTRL